MKKSYFFKAALVFAAGIFILSFQNCSKSSFQSLQVKDFQSMSSTTNAETIPGAPADTSNEASTTEKVLVSVGVGIGGRILTGINGFENVISDTQVFSTPLQLTIHTNPSDSSKLVCPVGGWQQIGSACCLKDQYECIGAGWHSDFLWRSVTFGNGIFVAVGGATFGISMVSNDGLNWSEKYNLVASSGLVTGASNSASWLSGVAFGNGKFVAVEGYTGKLFTSTDGKNWVATGSAPPVRNTLRRIYYMGNRFYASGDNASWGFTDDTGSSWVETGSGGPAPVEIYLVGNDYYGFSGNTIYRIGPNETSWNTVYTHPSSIGSFAYNSVTKKFHIFSGSISYSSSQADSGWVSKTGSVPSRWSYFTGQHFIGNGTMYSSDGLVWKTGATPIPPSEVIQQYTSGLVDKNLIDP